ncbi:MAG: hypothetical protein EXS51_04065 [Candidatus Taylorbacteria bacterium]|nr:hypothetical protein [Candidatus Taylorbacteria bacterium]
MLSILLLTASTFFSEVGASLGKEEVSHRKETIYTYGFLSLVLSTLVFIGIAVLRGEFLFSSGSLPTLTLRIVLEIVQSYVSIKAITIADRSTFGFLRVLTIPLLLMVDLSLGYVLTPNELIGASLLTVSLLFLFLNHGLRYKGIGFVLFSACNAVLTVSLFKYDVSHFNSVEVEQGSVQIILLLFFMYMAWRTTRKNPIRLLVKPLFLFQSASQAIAGVLSSFAYLYIPASVAMSIDRSLSVFFSMFAGNRYFHEKKLVQKFVSLLLLIIGFAFLAGFPW